jgi:hypothetical protein
MKNLRTREVMSARVLGGYVCEHGGTAGGRVEWVVGDGVMDFFFEKFEICREVCFRRKYVEAEEDDEDDDTLVYGRQKNPRDNHRLYTRDADTVQV